ncbi:hypothetical protein M0802_001957 [Mischocyttarus mexicanus]|nr:hypothetical protein M0802_001957 [Mischocyttarus mexicanus]
MITQFTIELFTIKREEKNHGSLSKLQTSRSRESIIYQYENYRCFHICSHRWDLAIVENAKNGNIAEDDDKLPCFAACFLKKMAILSPEGNLNEEVLHAKLPSSIPKDKAEEVIQKCKSLGGASICEKGGNLMKCFLQNKKFIILN